MTGLTPTQWKMLGFIEAFVAQHGYSPTYVEIQAFMGFGSKSGVHRIICQLEKRGRITRLAGCARSVLATGREGSLSRETSVAA